MVIGKKKLFPILSLDHNMNVAMADKNPSLLGYLFLNSSLNFCRKYYFALFYLFFLKLCNYQQSDFILIGAYARNLITKLSLYVRNFDRLLLSS
jgi:hypothetical protein